MFETATLFTQFYIYIQYYLNAQYYAMLNIADNAGVVKNIFEICINKKFFNQYQNSNHLIIYIQSYVVGKTTICWSFASLKNPHTPYIYIQFASYC